MTDFHFRKCLSTLVHFLFLDRDKYYILSGTCMRSSVQVVIFFPFSPMNRTSCIEGVFIENISLHSWNKLQSVRIDFLKLVDHIWCTCCLTNRPPTQKLKIFHLVMSKESGQGSADPGLAVMCLRLTGQGGFYGDGRALCRVYLTAWHQPGVSSRLWGRSPNPKRHCLKTIGLSPILLTCWGPQ